MIIRPVIIDSNTIAHVYNIGVYYPNRTEETVPVLIITHSRDKDAIGVGSILLRDRTNIKTLNFIKLALPLA